jgi:hypothetical protein
MEELLQRALRQAPKWIWRILPICALTGFALKHLSDLFRPSIDRYLGTVIDASTLNATTLSFASLVIVGPLWAILHYLNPNRRRARKVIAEIEVIEAVMERVELNQRERVMVRRAIVTALADATKQIGDRASLGDLRLAANREVPGLIDLKP